MQQTIKLNILAKDANISTKYIFIGDNATVKKILTKPIKLNTLNTTVLKNTYGPNWRSVLSIDEYIGGDSDITELQEQEQEQEEEQEKEQEQHISLEEIYSLSSIQDEVIEHVPHVQNNNSKIVIKYVFENIILNTYDTILEFKRKIAVLTQIPIYKQNISYNYTKKNYNLNYEIFIQNSIVQISMLNNIINNTQVELINDIPILINFYNIKNLINIKTKDTFSILDNFIEFGICEFNLFNLDDFIVVKELKQTNKNQLEIIFYGFVGLFWPMFSFDVWINYINNTTADFTTIYPELTTIDKHAIILEQQITNNAHLLFNDKNKIKQKDNIEKNMYISITSATVKVQSAYTTNIINLRNLFDSLELNDIMISCKCALTYNRNQIFLNKVYKNNTTIPNILVNNCLMIKIVGDLWVSFEFYIYTNGTYLVKSKWSEDKLYNFADILTIVSKTVNNTIAYINAMGNIVTSTNYTLELMNKKNHKFSDIYVSLIYRNPVKFYEFKIIENILKEYTKAGIVDLHDINSENNVLQYYFRKGMYMFNSERIDNSIVLNNYYNFLTNAIVKNKWEQLYQQTRNTTIQYRHGDIKISIEGIKDEEFNTFYMYVINIYDMLQQQKQNYVPEKIVKFNVKRNVKTLKYQDPLLYDFKKLYDSPIVYSRICQKKNQPIILSAEEYNTLVPEKKKTVLKYWNFTTKLPAYYQCPNPKYPHIQFTIKKHPKDYCIPCCKVKPIQTDDTSIKQLIYNTCLTKHVYTNEKTTVSSSVKYVMAYGKYITPGRICNLPEQTIEPLLYESFSESYVGLEQTCKNKYYVYGVEQDIKHTKYVGYISIMAIVLDLSIATLMTNVILALKKTPVHFKTIIDGKIIKYYKTLQNLIDAIQNTFIDTNAITQNTKVPWNLIFIDIAYYYFNIISIIFNDTSVQSQEYVKLQITNKINKIHLLDTSYKSIVLIKKNKSYNPIFNINTTVYFKTQLIDKKLFVSTDELVSIIIKVTEFGTTEVHKSKFTLDLLLLFTQHKNYSKYAITKYFINSHNLCYYTQVTIKNNVFYVPVIFSVYINNDAVDFTPLRIKTHTTQFSLLNTFIKDFNHWIAMISQHKDTSVLPLEQSVMPKYNYIMVNKWLYLDNPWQSGKLLIATNATKNIIGFICNGINFYHEPLSLDYVKTISKAPLERILYHPDIININLISTNAANDLRTKNITKNLYDYHLYELLVLEYIALLNKEKNIALRHTLKKEIIKRDDNNSEQIITNIKLALNTYYEQYVNVDECNQDTSKLISQINNYAINYRNKSYLLQQIDTTTYNFDKLKINTFKEMPKAQLSIELLKLSKQIVTIVKAIDITKALNNIVEFPNMFTSCQNNNVTSVYCKKNKLLITSIDLHNLLEIMVSDILNPFKNKFFFNALFTDNIISYLKFIKRPDEYIEIQSR